MTRLMMASGCNLHLNSSCGSRANISRSRSTRPSLRHSREFVIESANRSRAACTLMCKPSSCNVLHVPVASLHGKVEDAL